MTSGVLLPSVRPRSLSEAARTIPRPAASSFVHVGVVGVAIAGWIVAVNRTDIAGIGDFGLLPLLPIIYYVALALLLFGFVCAVTLSGPVRPWQMIMYLVALVLVIHGTAPLLYHEPRYAWTYKHLAVTDLIATKGSVDRSLDIYNNWPGLFAAAAWLQRLSGIDMITIAGWAMVFFSLATLASVHYLAGALTRNPRIVWLTTFLFLIGSWVGTEYYSPQALAFVLGFAFLGVVLRGTTPRRAPAWLHGWLADGPDDTAAPTQRSAPGREAVVVGGLLWVAVVVTHQLTPVFLLVAVVGLMITRRIPIWAITLMVFAELGWLALAWNYLHSHYALLNSPTLESPLQAQGGSLAHAEAGVKWSGYGSDAVVASFVATTMLALLADLRRRAVLLAALVLVLAPIIVVPIQAYGGEGVFRAYIFALPGMALLTARLVVSVRARMARAVVLVPLVALIATGLMLAYFGLEGVNYISSDDVTTSAYVETHLANPNSETMYLVSNFPSPLSARYAADHLAPGATDDVVLSNEPSVASLASAAQGLRLVARIAAESKARSFYVIMSGSQERYDKLYGVYRLGFLQQLVTSLQDSPSFRTIFHAGDGQIFRYVGRRVTSSTSAGS